MPPHQSIIPSDAKGELECMRGIASGQKVGFDFEGMAKEVGAMVANSANAEKLTVEEAAMNVEGLA